MDISGLSYGRGGLLGHFDICGSLQGLPEGLWLCQFLAFKLKIEKLTCIVIAKQLKKTIFGQKWTI